MGQKTVTAPRTGARRRRALIGLTGLVLLIAVASRLPVIDWLQAAEQWINLNPVGGWLAFIAGCIGLSMLMSPGSVLMLAGGYLFGLADGWLPVSIGIALGATGAAFVSRTLARDWVESRVAADRRYAAIDRAVAEQGMQIVVLSRLSLLIPYNLLNIIYGLSGIPLWQLAVSTWVGMLPAVVLYTYLGSIAGNAEQLLSSDSTDGPWRLAITVSSVVMIGVATWVIHRIATRALRRELGKDASADAEN